MIFVSCKVNDNFNYVCNLFGTCLECTGAPLGMSGNPSHYLVANGNEWNSSMTKFRPNVRKWTYDRLSGAISNSDVHFSTTTTLSTSSAFADPFACPTSISLQDFMITFFPASAAVQHGPHVSKLMIIGPLGFHPLNDDRSAVPTLWHGLYSGPLVSFLIIN